MTMSEVLQKVLDNANLGKAVTDVGPGFLLSISLLMMAALWSGVSVIPADQLRNFKKEYRLARIQVIEAKTCMKDVMDQKECDSDQFYAQIRAKLPNGNDEDSERKIEEILANAEQQAESIFVRARRKLADLTAAIEQQNALKAKGASEGAAVQDVALSERISVQKEIVEERVANYEKSRNQVFDSGSLEYNLVTFTKNIAIVIAFSVVMGVLVSQISHWLFIDLLYSRFSSIKLLDIDVSIAQILSKEDDELVKNYYRYAEGSVNSIFPVLLFGMIGPAFSGHKLDWVAPVWSFWTRAITFLIALFLGFAGYYTYKSFLKKRKTLADEISAGTIQVTSRV